MLKVAIHRLLQGSIGCWKLRSSIVASKTTAWTKNIDDRLSLKLNSHFLKKSQLGVKMKQLLLSLFSIFLATGVKAENTSHFLDVLKGDYWTNHSKLIEFQNTAKSLKKIEVQDGKDLSNEECLKFEEKIQKNYFVKFTYSESKYKDNSKFSLCFNDGNIHSVKLVNQSGIANFNNAYASVLRIARTLNPEISRRIIKVAYYFLDSNFKVVEIHNYISNLGEEQGYSIKSWDSINNFYEFYKIGLTSYRITLPHEYNLEKMRYVSADGFIEYHRDSWYHQFSPSKFISEDRLVRDEKTWNALEYNIAQERWYTIPDSPLEKNGDTKRTSSVYVIKRFGPTEITACEGGKLYKKGSLEEFANRDLADSDNLRITCGLWDI